MKTTNYFFIAVFLIINTAVFAQWNQLDIPELRKSNVFDFFYADDVIYANCGFSFMKYNSIEQEWSYAGDGLFENAYYQMFEKMVLYNQQIYTQVGNTIKTYNSSLNVWEDVNLTLPAGIPYSSFIARIGATTDMFYMIMVWFDGGVMNGNYFTTTDFQTWTQGSQIDESFFTYQVLEGTKDYIWLSTPNGEIVYSEDAIDFSTVLFGTVPAFDEPWSYRSRIKSDTENNCLFYEGPDQRLFRYNIQTADWDTVSNNLPPGVGYIGFEAADNLIYVLTFSGLNVQGLISNNTGDSWQSVAGGLGVIPQIEALTKVGDNNYICVNLLGQVLISNDNGLNFAESNNGFINGWHYLEQYGNKFYTPQTGDGVYYSNVDDLDFNLDNTGLPNTLNVLMIEDIVTTNNKVFAVVIEDLFSETLALYYKSDENPEWTKIDDVGVVDDMRILGKDMSNSIYVITFSEVEDKSIMEYVYKISDNIELTDLSSVLTLPHDRLMSIVGNSEGHLFLHYKYIDGDDSNIFRVYHSNDGGDTWVNIENDYDNFEPVQVVKNLFYDDENKALSFIDSEGNPVYMLRVADNSGIPYENIIVKYNIELEQWEQIPEAGLPNQLVYAGAIDYEDGTYYLALPHGLFYSDDLSSWDEYEYIGLRDGMVPNSLHVIGNNVYMGTLANGIWYVSLEVFKEDLSADQICVYPNPASEIINIQNLDADTKINLFDSSGRLLYQSETHNSDVDIDISKLNSGLYFIELQSLEGKVTKKIIVE